MMPARTAAARMRGLPIRSFADGLGTDPILVLAPHPDDESLGCGGLIAEACRCGSPPTVAILTDGAGSHPNSRSHPAATLQQLRKTETWAAVGALGLPPQHLTFLGYPDRAAPRTGTALEAAAARVAALIADRTCRTVIVSWRQDPHCDHQAAAAIAQRACRMTGARLLAYPVWAWTLPPDRMIDEVAIDGFRLDIGHHVAAKRAAIAAHRSQYAGIITDDPDGFQMTPDFIEMFVQPTETYLDMDAAA